MLDGTLVDSVPSFFCAIGEAVNGPGGYFGLSLTGFQDCLYGGFGLEAPYTIRWRNHERSRETLNAEALVAYIQGIPPDPLAGTWCTRTLAAALAGKRTMFDEILETMASVPTERLQLVLE